MTNDFIIALDMTNDFIIALDRILDPQSRGCEIKGEITKCVIAFYIPGGTKEYAKWGRVDFEDPGRILVYLNDNTAVYNQQNVRYQAIDLNGSATKPPPCLLQNAFLRWLSCDNTPPYIVAREENNNVRSLELYFKHPSDFKPEFLDVSVSWENTIIPDSNSPGYSNFDYGWYRIKPGLFGFAPLEEVTEDRTFKFEIGTPLGWQPEIANPNNLNEKKGRVFRRFDQE
jgi:hypothetical protein